jgi:branched-chain amino acid transport system substrate-binding protein
LSRHENAGVSLVANENFNGSDLSVAAQLTRIRSAGPSVLMLWSTGTPLGTVFRALKEANYSLPVMVSTLT